MLNVELKRIKKKYLRIKILSFFAVLFLFAVVAMIIPLRPSASAVEKRDLAKFPEFSMETFINGEYFAAIDTWYADTFPFRDVFLRGNTLVSSLNGIQTVKIKGELTNVDEIPDFENRIDEEDETFANESEEDAEVAETTPANESDNKVEEFVPEVVDEVEDAPIEVATQKLGTVFIAGDSVYEYYGFNQASSDGYVNVINNITERLAGKATVYDIIVPNSMDITLNDSIRKSLATSNQNDAINYMYSKMSKNVKVVPIYKTLREHKKEYVYFRTDHHWTALGAYYAYEKFAKVKGIKAASLDDFEMVAYDGFLGSFYAESGQLPALAANPDTVYGYIPKSTNSMKFVDKNGNEIAWNIVYDVSGWNSSTKYNAFIGGDNPLSIIENPDINDGSSCVVIKESYGNAFVPFLVANYQTIYVVDYRYYNEPLYNFIINNGIKDVIFINNVVATGTPARIENLEHLTR